MTAMMADLLDYMQAALGSTYSLTTPPVCGFASSLTPSPLSSPSSPSPTLPSSPPPPSSSPANPASTLPSTSSFPPAPPIAFTMRTTVMLDPVAAAGQSAASLVSAISDA